MLAERQAERWRVGDGDAGVSGEGGGREPATAPATELQSSQIPCGSLRPTRAREGSTVVQGRFLSLAWSLKTKNYRGASQR